jgi:hypothetical protein
VEAGFACSKAPMTPVVLRWEIKGILCFYEGTHVCVCVGGHGMCMLLISSEQELHPYSMCARFLFLNIHDAIICSYVGHRNFVSTIPQ